MYSRENKGFSRFEEEKRQRQASSTGFQGRT